MARLARVVAPGVVVRKFAERGWSVSRHAKRPACRKCVAKFKASKGSNDPMNKINGKGPKAPTPPTRKPGPAPKRRAGKVER